MPPVAASTPNSSADSSSPARERLIKAAALVFARDGLQRATTRVIAQEAGVNEVTLFRHFENKERLLAEVLAHECALHRETLGGDTPWTQDLREDLLAYAGLFNTMLEKNHAMIRTLIGEGHRNPDYARKVIQESMKPSRDRFIAYLESGRKEGRVRSDVPLSIAVDMFTGMLLAGMLRRTSGKRTDYTAQAYLDNCVEIFVSGIAPTTSHQSESAPTKPRKAAGTKAR